MGTPHNPERYGEIWSQARIDATLYELEAIKRLVVLSGGWAWHVLSSPDHPEYKHAHDHKDVDLFVAPQDVTQVVVKLKASGFERIATRYDGLPNNADFRRYEKRTNAARIIIDLFVRSVPERKIDGWRVIEPSYLLTLYGDIHSSDRCWAVLAAQRLLAAGIDPQGRPELTEPPL